MTDADALLATLRAHTSKEAPLLCDSMDDYFHRVTPTLYRLNAERVGSSWRQAPSTGADLMVDRWVLPTGETVFVGYPSDDD